MLTLCIIATVIVSLHLLCCILTFLYILITDKAIKINFGITGCILALVTIWILYAIGV